MNAATFAQPVLTVGRPTSAVFEYRRHQVEGASPIQRIILVYDVALRACAQRDLALGTAALRVLEDGLDFSAGEIAGRLFRLYQYSADLMRRNNYEDAAALLRELREAWAEAQRRMSVNDQVADGG